MSATENVFGMNRDPLPDPCGMKRIFVSTGMCDDHLTNVKMKQGPTTTEHVFSFCTVVLSTALGQHCLAAQRGTLLRVKIGRKKNAVKSLSTEYTTCFCPDNVTSQTTNLC